LLKLVVSLLLNTFTLLLFVTNQLLTV